MSTMNKMSVKEEIDSLKMSLQCLEAQFLTIYGELLNKKIINDEKFENDSDKMLEYIEQDEERCEITCNNNLTYTSIKSHFVKNELKKTSWRERGYIDDLMYIELMASGKTLGLPTGYIRSYLKEKYPKQWKAICLELDPKGYQKALQHDQKKKEEIERDEKKFKKECDEDLQKEKEAWKRAGGKNE